MRRSLLLLALVLGAAGLSGCKTDDDTGDDIRTVVDHNGTTVTITGEIKRVVIYDMPLLAPSLIQYLGSSEKIVGMPNGSVQNNSVGLKVAPNLAEIANTSSMSIEDVINLEPDLVLSSYIDTEKLTNFRAVGLTTVAMNASTQGIDAVGTISDWNKLFEGIFGDTSRSSKINTYNTTKRDYVKNAVKGISAPNRKKILYIPWFNGMPGSLWTSSNEYVAGYFAETTNAVNVAADSDVNVALTVEEVINMNPDVIYLGSYPPSIGVDAFFETDFVKNNLSTINAVKNKDVYRIPGGGFNWFMPTSAEIALSLMFQAKCQYPTAFATLDMRQEVKDFYTEFYEATLTEADLDIVFKN